MIFLIAKEAILSGELTIETMASPTIHLVENTPNAFISEMSEFDVISSHPVSHLAIGNRVKTVTESGIDYRVFCLQNITIPGFTTLTMQPIIGYILSSNDLPIAYIPFQNPYIPDEESNLEIDLENGVIGHAFDDSATNEAIPLTSNYVNRLLSGDIFNGFHLTLGHHSPVDYVEVGGDFWSQELVHRGYTRSLDSVSLRWENIVLENFTPDNPDPINYYTVIKDGNVQWWGQFAEPLPVGVPRITLPLNSSQFFNF